MKRHAIRWTLLIFAVVIACTTSFWWQRMAALPMVTAAAWLMRCQPARKSFIDLLELVPYLDPVRGSNRTGQLIYQFVRLRSDDGDNMTTTLEQLIASFLQIGLAKVDTKLSATTQQLISSAVPTLVSTIASVIVDLANEHTATKAKPSAA